MTPPDMLDRLPGLVDSLEDNAVSPRVSLYRFRISYDHLYNQRSEERMSRDKLDTSSIGEDLDPHPQYSIQVYSGIPEFRIGTQL